VHAACVRRPAHCHSSSSSVAPSPMTNSPAVLSRPVTKRTKQGRYTTVPRRPSPSVDHRRRYDASPPSTVGDETSNRFMYFVRPCSMPHDVIVAARRRRRSSCCCCCGRSISRSQQSKPDKTPIRNGTAKRTIDPCDC